MQYADNYELAKNQFWRDVEGILSGEYHHSKTTAEHGIATYKRKISNGTQRMIVGEDGEGLEESDAGVSKITEVAVLDSEVIFNQGEERTAEIINRIINSEL